ncbi:MAG TPA: EAL domain-containing protein [Acidimicrobiia bacterium]|jgi:diguanylate cyclase (GGDEF)-like protein
MRGVQHLAASTITGIRERLTQKTTGFKPARVLTRLLWLVTVPVVAMAALSGILVARQRTSAERAARVERHMPGVNALVALDEALHNEQASVVIIREAADLHLTPRALGQLIGFDLDVIGPRRAATDAAIRGLGRAVPFDVRVLRSTRAAIDSQTVDPTEANAAFTAFDTEVAATLDHLVHHLGQDANDVNGGRALVDALEALDAASTALRAGAAQTADMADLALGPQSRTPGALVALGRDGASYARAFEQLRTYRPHSLDGALRRVTTAPGPLAFEQAVTAAQEGRVTRASTPQAIVDLSRRFGGAFERDDLLYALVGRSAKLVNATAVRLRTHEQDRYRRAVAYVAVLGLGVLLAALALALTITRPLRRLVAHAGAVTDGRLDVDELPPRGPRETRLMSSAFNDLVANLRLLESKTNALAGCDFDDPVLGQRLPGRLGQSIEDSVRVLWGSIEERNALQERLADQATHDPLTGMYNRAAAISAIEQALARSRRTGDAVALLHVDLDDFKLANDTHGHEIGDRVLREVGARMGRVVRAGDVVARLGSDEFLVLAERIVDITEATTLARRVVDAVSAPISAGIHRITVGASVGVALALDGNDEALPLLARADMALDRAKRRGRSLVELYDESLQEQLLERADIEHALSAALTRGDDELSLHYQPVTDTVTGSVVGCEALLRWDRPGHGRVPPDAFIPVAETSPLIVDVDLWVLDTATRQLAEWSRHADLRDLTVAVNVSGRHLLGRSLDTHVRDALERNGADPGHLVLEITETVLLSDLPTAASQLESLRALGIRVAIDDFGTGYTSLATLQQLPIDTIKIDRSFVNRIDEPRDRSLVRMVTELGHQLGVEIVAEGVETGDQRNALADTGCDAIQGFLVCRPVPAGDFTAWCEARARDHANREAS